MGAGLDTAYLYMAMSALGMIPVMFLAFMRALVGEAIPCKHCVFMPWPSLLAVYLSCFLLRRVEQTCSGLLQIGVHAAAAAAVFSHSPTMAFACSLHSILHLMPALAGDEVTMCVLCCYGVALLGLVARFCSHAVSSDVLIVALVWPRVVDVAFVMLHRLLWGGQ
jgi:hypothetical protein